MVLTSLPASFLGDLPIEDQRAISEMLGKKVLLTGYDNDDRAELEFTEHNGTVHTIWVSVDHIRRVC